jgi:HSP20 family protein
MARRLDPFADVNWALGPSWNRSAESALPMDAVRTERGVTVRFDLPGVDPAAVELTVEKSQLTVSAERPDEAREGEHYITRERPSGKFARTVHLGQSLDAANVEASWDNGVLTVHIPIAEAAKPRRVEIAAAPREAELTS